MDHFTTQALNNNDTYRKHLYQHQSLNHKNSEREITLISFETIVDDILFGKSQIIIFYGT